MRPAIVWFSSSILFLSLLTGCGRGKYDLTNASDRAALKIDVQNSLTKYNCVEALDLISQLYDSEYSDNETRTLYASAHGCNVGIKLYDLMDALSTLVSVNPIGEFARYFPSTVNDSRMASSWYATDAIQAVLNPGTVVAPTAKIFPLSFNVGSTLVQDRTDDANVYLTFLGMASVGTALNRYGSPTGTYNQGANLPWETRALVQSDLTGASCGIVSGFLNFFDGAHVALKYLSGATATNLANVLNLLESSMINTDPIRGAYGGYTFCNASYPQTECTAAYYRLRYRGACAESNQAATFAAGMMGAINDLWL